VRIDPAACLPAGKVVKVTSVVADNHETQPWLEATGLLHQIKLCVEESVTSRVKIV
jgi:hypothetical protein